jgi:hypothetical protein
MLWQVVVLLFVGTLQRFDTATVGHIVIFLPRLVVPPPSELLPDPPSPRRSIRTRLGLSKQRPPTYYLNSK